MIENMRILHFMNSPLPVDLLVSGGDELKTSGGWLTTLVGQLLKKTNHTFACASYGKVKKVQVSKHDRLDSYIIPGDLAKSPIDNSLRECRRVIEEWKPDLLHIHGTEASYGLLTARRMVSVPAVISLQGLIGPYSEWYRYFGNSSILDIVKMHRLLEIPALRGHWIRFYRIRKMAKREREIIAGNRFFMGRTSWDHAYIRALNPSARYFHGGELLREAFWHCQWKLEEVRRHRIIFTNAGGYPRKGTEMLLEAVKLLKSDFPDIRVAIAGGISRRSGYGRYVRRRISELGQAAIELGQLNAEEMVQELAKSHVFVSPSYIDNSPNAVCEAQLIGMPVVSTYTGGVPSLIQENRTGLFFPTGDAPMLAAILRQVFEDNELAIRLGKQAQEVAFERHDTEAIIHDVITAYKAVFNESKQLLK